MNKSYQMYFGELSDNMQTAVRERVDWIVSRVSGENVLDVGCSQGIVPLLLSRQNKRVTGIDISDEAINFAREVFSREEESVKKNVSFLCGNFYDYDFGEARFDTVCICEVLEHIPDCAPFIDRAYDLLPDAGTLIVTVPFGINRDPDHVRTFYLTELYNLIDGKFSVTEVKFFNIASSGWIGMTAVKGESGRAKRVPLDDKLFAEAERSVYIIEDALRDKLSLRKDSVEKSRDRVSRLTRERDSLRVKYQSAMERADEYKASIRTDKERYKSLKVKYNALSSSKLGRLQLKYWSVKKKSLVKAKALARRSRLLVKLVGLLRKKRPNLLVVAGGSAPVKPKDVFDEKRYDLGFFDTVKELVAQLPESNGGRYYEPSSTRVGLVTDRFMYDTFRDSAQCSVVTPDNWRELIDELDVLFILSPWRGVNNDWMGLNKFGTESREQLFDIISEFKVRDKATVFYSKEDPPNYELFLAIAQKCDYVFTTARECIPQYIEDCGNDKVALLPFGVNPLFHNPVGFRSFPKRGEVIFSGSWRDRYPERCEDMNIIFSGVESGGRGLKIIDRNLFVDRVAGCRYPERYYKYISPPIDHDVLQKLHKLYDWAINMNSVKESTTMFASRGYELQASGNLMLSNYSVAVNSYLPYLFTCQHSDEIPRILGGFTDEEVYMRQAAGIRFAMSGNTCFDRMAHMLTSIGIPTSVTSRRVAVAVREKTPELEEYFNNQSYPDKELVTEAELDGDVFASADIIAFFREGAYYGSFYLEDMINAFKYTDCDYITKAAYRSGGVLCEGLEHDYVGVMPDKYRTVFWARSFSADALLEMTGAVTLPNGYSVDHFGFDDAPVPVENDDVRYELSVGVAVYNNGPRLLGKCFNSLCRSSIFDRMEIILVDDGSTDEYTKCIIRELEHEYPNVRAYFFPTGGSGGASRPRNKAVELATADHVAFLDPGNEAVEDAYARLLAIAKDGDVELVWGDVRIFGRGETRAENFKYVTQEHGEGLVEGDKRKLLRDINFHPISTQAMVAKRSLFTDNALERTVGGEDADALLSWQLNYCAGKVLFTDIPVHICYTEVLDSLEGSVGPGFFEKSLKKDIALKEWFTQVGMLDDYMRLRFNAYYKGWYLEKLLHSKPEQREECVRVLMQIMELFRDGYDGKDKVINAFLEKCDRGQYTEAFNRVESLLAAKQNRASGG